MFGVSNVLLEPLLERPGSIDRSREAVRQHCESGGDAGQQEYRRDRRLDQMNDIHECSAGWVRPRMMPAS